jgi:hypothetical protein
MDGEEQYFCYYTISSTAELIIQSVLIAVSLLLVGDAFRKFYRMRGSHNDHVAFIYRLLLIWWLSNRSTIQSLWLRTASQ